MTDFFDALERQLVAATAERPHRLRRARARRAATVAGVLVVLLSAGAGLASAVSGTGTDDRRGTPAATTAPTVPVSPRTAAILQRQTVAVLNGTSVPGLARGVATRLVHAGITVGNVTNAAEQSRAATCVTFAPGHEGAARRVAAVLALAAPAIAPATAADRAAAGPRATVIVTVGADQSAAPDRKAPRTP